MKRRDFLRHSAGAALGSRLLLPFGSLGLTGAALAADGRHKGLADYKALVCVFLGGGNDAFNMIVPRDATTHGIYSNARGGSLVIDRSAAEALPLNPLVAPDGGGEYGLHPGMEGIRQLFDSGDCAVVANVGPLLYPVSRAAFQAGSVPVPPQLFSHSDQQLFWETSWPDATERNGWGGRIADLLHTSNLSQVSMCVSLSGSNMFQVGRVVQPYFMGVDGTETVFFTEGDWQQRRRDSFDAIRQLAASSSSHVFERAYAGIMQRALDNHALVSAALASVPEPQTTFPDSPLGRQLQMVARLIAARGSLGMSRQIFYVVDHGYDTHDDQLEQHAGLLANLSACLHAFHAATVDLGVADAVTSFTASDFGRSVSVNGDGTDHGWGGHHLVVGGAVQGRRFYGRMPDLTREGPDDAGWGQIIPTTAVDQYAATLARWFGVSDAQIADVVVPNIGRFATADLGFMG